jgi:hypothetical protein
MCLSKGGIQLVIELDTRICRRGPSRSLVAEPVAGTKNVRWESSHHRVVDNATRRRRTLGGRESYLGFLRL